MSLSLRGARILIRCLLVSATLTLSSSAQNVWTWHNDNNRTGWQSNESQLTTKTVSQTTFGLIWQWLVTGAIYAQPLAIANLPNVANCSTNPCNLVFVATEQDMLYAFDAALSSQSAVWSTSLATPVSGVPVDCTQSQNQNYPLCTANGGTGLLGRYVGVTGTPVVDTSASPKTLYVVAAVEIPSGTGQINYYLFAVNIATGTVLGYTDITGTVAGESPLQCATSSGSGIVSFDSNHIQRSALLLLNDSGTPVVYVAFAPGDGETENGWLFGYKFNGSAFSQAAIFNSTPYGTGGGIWQSGAGPASDGNYIYLATGNGTFDLSGVLNPSTDAGDSLLRLNPSDLSMSDYYTPSDVFSKNRCNSDLDFGSGGVLLPTNFTYKPSRGTCSNGCNVIINADKESRLYVANILNLGQYNANGGNNIQTTPPTPPPPGNDQSQGYWSSPAYWSYTSQSTTYYMLYYSANAPNTRPPGQAGVAPLPINAYQLLTDASGGPIPSTYASTVTLFCQYSPTPSGSWNSASGDAASAILWAMEIQQNSHNIAQYRPPDCAGSIPPHDPVALHAFNATTLAEIYSSRGLSTLTGKADAFPTPTIFMGQVYVGTETLLDVFGFCSTQSNGCDQ